MKTKSMELFEQFWIDHTGCGMGDFCFHEGCYTCEYMQDAWETWQSQQAKIDELQARVDKLQKHSLMLREAAKSWSYNEGEKNILISQADDLDRILKGNKDEN